MIELVSLQRIYIILNRKTLIILRQKRHEKDIHTYFTNRHAFFKRY